GDYQSLCAASSDRIYVFSSLTLYVYDNAGSLLRTIPLGISDVEQITADNSHIYMSRTKQNDLGPPRAWNLNQHIAVVDRHVVRDTNGNITSETFQQRPQDMLVTPVQGYVQALTVDMLDVLNGPK